ncbi:MAG: LytTR family DNA-binding domain-containing protein [Bacteroidota bacterium]
MDTALKVVIIDDEQNSRDFLDFALHQFNQQVKVVGQAEDVDTGVHTIRKHQPDLVFLDIEMPGGNGFDILEQCQDIPFRVVVVTGYDQYAIKAIKYSALDYLLKPVNLRELTIAIERVRQTDRLTTHQQYQLLKDQLNKPLRPHNQLILSGSKGYKLLHLDQINYVEADGNYARFHLSNGQSQLAIHHMGYYEALLPSNQFFRIHKSYLINIQNVVQYLAGRGGKVQMQSEAVLPVAIRRKTEFVERLKGLGKI